MSPTTSKKVHNSFLRPLLVTILLFVLAVVFSYPASQFVAFARVAPPSTARPKWPEHSVWIAYSPNPNYGQAPRKLKAATNVNVNGNCGYDAGGSLIGNWQCDVLAPMPQSSDHHGVSIALDKDNTPHISFYMEAAAPCPGDSGVPFGDLGYAVRLPSGNGNCGPGNQWRCDRVDRDDCRIIGESSSIAFDHTGKPYISYSDRELGSNGHIRLKIATPKSGGNCGPSNTWQCDVLDEISGTWVGDYNSILIDNAGIVHVAYWDANEGDSTGAQLYAKRVGSGGNCGNGAWECRKIDVEGNVGHFSGPRSMAIDRDGIVYITSHKRIPPYSDLEGALRVNKYVGSGGNCGYDLSGNFVGDWECENVEEVQRAGNWSSIVFDKQNIPHSFHGRFNEPRDISHAYYVGGGAGNCVPNSDWNCEIIQSAEYLTVSGDLYLHETPVVTFSDRNNRFLNVATKIPGNCGPSNDWDCQVIDNTPNSGFPSGIWEKAIVAIKQKRQ